MTEISTYALATIVLVLATLLYRSKFRSPSVLLQKQLAEQTKKTNDLEKVVEEFTRPRLGLVARWSPSSEQESTYTLNIYNDHPERIFNLTVKFPQEYSDCCEVNVTKTILDADAESQAYFFPDRRHFARAWLDNKLETIMFTVQYTETPVNKNFRTLQVPFKVSNTPEHFRSWLKAIAKSKVD